GLEGPEPLEREIRILNTPTQEQPAPENLWDEEDPTLPLPSRKRNKNLGHEIPMASIEIPLPDPLEPFPDIGAAPAAVQERRVTDVLVKEVTVPLTLTEDELKRHRKLRVKITLDITIE